MTTTDGQVLSRRRRGTHTAPPPLPPSMFSSHPSTAPRSRMGRCRAVSGDMQDDLACKYPLDSSRIRYSTCRQRLRGCMSRLMDTRYPDLARGQHFNTEQRARAERPETNAIAIPIHLFALPQDYSVCGGHVFVCCQSGLRQFCLR